MILYPNFNQAHSLIFHIRPRSASLNLQNQVVPPLNEFCLLQGVDQQFCTGLTYSVATLRVNKTILFNNITPIEDRCKTTSKLQFRFNEVFSDILFSVFNLGTNPALDVMS